MQIRIQENDDTPIYQQIVDSISKDILSGTLPPGYKLPTVRDLADDAGVSRGTVKHAYDHLEHLGLIEMTQGRGTFVCEQQAGNTSSKKEQAMQIIDAMLNDMLQLSFSFRDIRIFFDLKMREREEMYPHVRIGIIDCNPEALAVSFAQLSTFPNVEAYQFLLEDVLQNPEKLGNDLDLIVTTSTHFSDLEYKIPESIPLMRIVLSVSSTTILQLARLAPENKVGILAASNKYASTILRGCSKFTSLAVEPAVLLFGSHLGIEPFLAAHDVLIVPANYYKYCNRQEEESLARWSAEGNILICYDYHIDRGSLLYIGEQIEKIYTSRQSAILD